MDAKKLIIPILFMILLSCSCLAVKVFEGTVEEEIEKDIGGKTISMRYYEANDKVSLNVIDDSKYLLIDAGSCETEGLWEYCIESVSLEDREIEKNGQTLLEEYYEIDIIVNKQSPEIEIASAVSNEEPGIDERFDVTYTLTNTGDLDASDVAFELTIPDGVELVSVSATIAGNKVLWNTYLGRGDSKDLKIVLKGKDFGEYELKSKASYEAAGEMQDATDEFDVEIPFPYSVSTDMSLGLAAPGESTTYTLTISNANGSDTLLINSLEIEFPSSLDIKSAPTGFSIERNKLTGTDQLDSGNSKDYSVKLSTRKEGDYSITADLELRMGQMDFHEELTTEFGVGVGSLVPTIEISDESPKAYDSVTFEVYLYNRDSVNITTSPVITSDLFDMQIPGEFVIEADEKVKVFEKTITIPTVEEGDSSYITIDGNYDEDTGDEITYAKTATLTLQEEEKVVKVTQESEVDGDTVTINVYVENLKANTLESVDIFDMLPTGFKVEGDQFNTIELGAFAKEKIISYTTTIPTGYSEDSFLIEHTVNIEDSEGELLIQEIGLRVNLGERAQIELSEEVNAEVENETLNESGSEEAAETSESDEEEKPGFFGKVWGWLKSLLT